MKGGLLLASIAAHGAKAHVNSRDLISAAVKSEFGDLLSAELEKHGCWASKLDENNPLTGGTNRVDEVDEIFAKWFGAYHCLSAEGGRCFGDEESSSTCADGLELVNNVYVSKLQEIDLDSFSASITLDCPKQAPKDNPDLDYCKKLIPEDDGFGQDDAPDGGIFDDFIDDIEDNRDDIINQVEDAIANITNIASVFEFVNQLQNSGVDILFELAEDWLGPELGPNDDISSVLGALVDESGMDADEEYEEENGRRRRSLQFPKSFDLRANKYCGWLVHQVQNQGKCGSCWANAAAGVIQDSRCIATEGKWMNKMSVQELDSCCDNCDRLHELRPGEVCIGGYASRAFTYYKKTGLVEEQCYPYEFYYGDPEDHFDAPGGFAYCKKHCKYADKAPLEDARLGGRYTTSVVRSKTVYSMMKHIYLHGSMVMSFDVSKSFFAYKSGVFEVPAGDIKKGRHAVRIIGWGTDKNGVDYWTAVNSWKTTWGDGGTFKIRRGVNEAHCEHYGFWGLRHHHYQCGCANGEALMDVDCVKKGAIDCVKCDAGYQLEEAPEETIYGLPYTRNTCVKIVCGKDEHWDSAAKKCEPCKECYTVKQTGKIIIGGKKGYWQDGIKMCKKGFYVCGLQIGTDYGYKLSDRSGINSMKMNCCPAPDVSGSPSLELVHMGQDGHIWGPHSCKTGQFVCGMQVQYTGSAFDDDMGVTGIKAQCCQYDSWVYKSSIDVFKYDVGSWEPEINCPSNSLICGLTVRYEDKGSTDDNTGIQGISAECCKAGSHNGNTCDASGC